MKRQLLVPLTILFFSTPLFAMFCPTNFNNINIGDSIAQVKLQCGTPDAENTYKVPPDSYAAPQEWIYVIQAYNNQAYTHEPENGMRMSIIFQNKKSISITVNGAGRGETAICGSPIQTGDTMDTIKKACGDPAMINANKQTIQPQGSEITELRYTKNIPTPEILTFENGLLKERKGI